MNKQKQNKMEELKFATIYNILFFVTDEVEWV